MIKKFKNIFYLLCFLFFLIFIVKIYFSDENIRKTNKNRSLYSAQLNMNLDNLPILKNDTNNIIEYKDDIEKYKKKKNYKFWELLKNK
mgnify:CR=1 FL=1